MSPSMSPSMSPAVTLGELALGIGVMLVGYVGWRWALGWRDRRRLAAEAEAQAEARAELDALAREIAVEVLAEGYPLERVEVVSYGDIGGDAGAPQVRVLLRRRGDG